jgi:hypothetical protein
MLSASSSCAAAEPFSSGLAVLRGTSGDIGPGQEIEELWYWDVTAWRVHPDEGEAYTPVELACLVYIYVKDDQDNARRPTLP